MAYDVDARFSPEQRNHIETTRNNCKLLAEGYHDTIEYVEPVKYASGEVVEEKRVRKVKRPGYLDQLAEYSKNRDCDLNPKAARGAPRVKKAKLSPELNGFLALDEITCDIFSQLDKIYSEVGRDRTWLSTLPVKQILTALSNQIRYMIDEQGGDVVDDAAYRIARLTGKWVETARAALNHKVADTMFADVVCGNCSGGLAAPNRIEGGTAEVRCVGTPTTPPCGHAYPASEWLSLYEAGRRK